MVNKAYKYRLIPNSEQEELIKKTFGCVRFVYNQMLAERKEQYEKYQEDKEALKQLKLPTPAKYKKEYIWLNEVDSLALANAQLNLNTAYKNFFRDKSKGFPKFKSKYRDKKSYTTNNQGGTIRLIDLTHIRLPKLRDVRIKLHRPLPEDGIIKSATISQTATGKYYISILVEFEAKIKPVTPRLQTTLGLDYSAKSLYVDSQANSADYPKFHRKAEAKLHERVANQRKDFLHKLSRQLADKYEAVVIENLNMRSMAQGLKLAKSTNDNGFGMLKTFLEYKLKEQGKKLVIIDKWYPSSKLCDFCGTVNDGLTLADRVWTCSCGAILDRDINAAINIKNEGCRILGIA